VRPFRFAAAVKSGTARLAESVMTVLFYHEKTAFPGVGLRRSVSPARKSGFAPGRAQCRTGSAI